MMKSENLLKLGSTGGDAIWMRSVCQQLIRFRLRM